jgi:hypothetical protein
LSSELAPDTHVIQRIAGNMLFKEDERKPQLKPRPLLPLWGTTCPATSFEEKWNHGNKEPDRKTPGVAKPLLPIGELPKLP